MGATKSKKRNKNEYKKVYPYIRRRPVYTYELDKETVIETARVEFTDSDTGSYTFTETFPGAPSVTAIAEENSAGDNADVNIYIESISTTSITIRASESFTGFVNIHAVYVAE
jgi:hypothetical protein